jgi:leucine dehydrogenase
MAIELSAFNGGQQRILRIDDPASGAKGYIVVDSTVLGPAMGGCRFWRYDSDADALKDAQRLGRGMSLKNAMAGLPVGGGKSVLQTPNGAFERKAVFAAFGHALNAFAGDYLTAEDVGTNEQDMETVRSVSPHVFGLPGRDGVAGGNPSGWTALGVFSALQALVERAGGRLNKSKVAVQGVGSVGAILCEMLHQQGAELVVADVSEMAVARLAAKLPVEIRDVATIHQTDATVFAPCALGASLNERSIATLGASMVVGAANNQLATEEDGDRLHRRGVLYAPDYVVNAGGVINVAAEYLGESQASVEGRVVGIGQRILAVIARAEAEAIAPSAAADQMAAQILAERRTVFA